MFPFFWVLNRLGLLRVGKTEEALGLDAAQMGGPPNPGARALLDTKVGHFSTHKLVAEGVVHGEALAANDVLVARALKISRAGVQGNGRSSKLELACQTPCVALF